MINDVASVFLEAAFTFHLMPGTFKNWMDFTTTPHYNHTQHHYNYTTIDNAVTTHKLVPYDHTTLDD